MSVVPTFLEHAGRDPKTGEPKEVNTATFHAQAVPVREGKYIMLELPEGRFRLHAHKKLIGRLAQHLGERLRVTCYFRSFPNGALRHLELRHFEPAEPAPLLTAFHAIGKFRRYYQEDGVTVGLLRIYPNPHGQLRVPYRLALRFGGDPLLGFGLKSDPPPPERAPVRVYGTLKGCFLEVQTVQALPELPARDERYKQQAHAKAVRR